jgi:hypothetical protein
MRHILNFTLIISQAIFAQTNFHKANLAIEDSFSKDTCKCSLKNWNQHKQKHFEYSQFQLDVIKNNWGLYFKEDLLPILEPTIANDFFEIKMDSYGSLYPEKEILNLISKDEFEGFKKNYADLRTHSFHKRFKYDNHEKIKNRIDKNEFPKIYKELYYLSKIDTDEEKFFKTWDNYHDSVTIYKLNDIIKQRGIVRVIFYIHGYNVPYSLAVIQAITTYKFYKENIPNGKVLFVPVYWPSNNAKMNNLNQDNFSIDNIKKFKTNGKLFLRYSNRCYYAAITLRKIINGIDTNVKMDIIAHSLGATIATTTLINTYTKLHYNRNSTLKVISDKPDEVLKIERNKYFGKDQINYDLLKRFYDKENTPPTRAINVFLSAAAIPGQITFVDMDDTIMQNKKFYVTINPCDEMVTKSEIRNQVKKKSLLKVNAINHNRLSSTSLGCNGSNDTDTTKANYIARVPSGIFKISKASIQIDHDLFVYLEQNAYQTFLKNFFNEK